MREHEIEERLLLAVEVAANLHLGSRSPFFSGEGSHRIGYMRQNVEQVAVLRIDDALHLRHLLSAESLLSQAL